MNGYLVVLRHEMDDIPLRLFGTREEAEAFAAAAGRAYDAVAVAKHGEFASLNF